MCANRPEDVIYQRLKILLAADETEFDVSVVDLSPEDEKTLNIALNKISGEWDETALCLLRWYKTNLFFNPYLKKILPAKRQQYYNSATLGRGGQR